MTVFCGVIVPYRATGGFVEGERDSEREGEREREQREQNLVPGKLLPLCHWETREQM